MMDKLGEQSRANIRKEPNRASLLASQTRGSSPCSFYKSYFSSPEPAAGTGLDRRVLFGTHVGSASEAKSCPPRRRGSRPLRSRGGARPQSQHLQNARTFRSRPAAAPTSALAHGSRASLSEPFYLGEQAHSTVFYRNYLSESWRVRGDS